MACCLLGGLGLLCTAPARAAFPGVNGKIAFDRGAEVFESIARQPVQATPFQIFTMDPSGADQTNLTQSSTSNLDPAWSADGRSIAFSRTQIGVGGQIWVMQADGSQQHKVSDGSGDDEAPVFSPDGTKIYFARDISSIWVMGSDGSSPHVLFTPPANHQFSNPSASADGTRIAFDDFDFGTTFTTQLRTGGADGSASQAVANQNADANNPDDNSAPDWSPDSRSLVFQKRPNAGGPRAVWVIGADGSGPHALTAPPTNTIDGGPAFSPNGAQITFQRVDFLSAEGVLWVMDASGSNAHAVTAGSTSQHDEFPNWQPQPALASSAAAPACDRAGGVTASVSDPSGFLSPPSAVRYQIDSGAILDAPVSGNPGTTTITLPLGQHTLIYWGADAAGYEEAIHHTLAVSVDQTNPRLAIVSDQHRFTFRRGQRASVTIRASDSFSGLARNPSRRHLRVSTTRLGIHTVRATAIDRCGNTTTGRLRYRVVLSHRRSVRRPRFTG